MLKLEPRWIKITATISNKLDLKQSKELAANWTRSFERTFNVSALYYARYTDLTSSRFEISALTSGKDQDILKYFRRAPGIQKVKIEYRGTGSYAHAHMYQALKYIPEFGQDAGNDEQFLDALHWACNMRGYDYMREARLFSYRALCLCHSQASVMDNVMKVAKRLKPEIERVSQEMAAEQMLENTKATDRFAVRKLRKRLTKVQAGAPKKRR